jgi:hypothetical protein
MGSIFISLTWGHPARTEGEETQPTWFPPFHLSPSEKRQASPFQRLDSDETASTPAKCFTQMPPMTTRYILGLLGTKFSCTRAAFCHSPQKGSEVASILNYIFIFWSFWSFALLHRTSERLEASEGYFYAADPALPRNRSWFGS